MAKNLNSKTFGFIITGIALLVISSVLAQPSSHTAIIQDHTFSAAYSKKYNALQGLSAETMVFDLSDSLEDLLITGSHVARTSLDYKVRDLKKILFTNLKKELCPSSRGSSSSAGFQSAAVQSLRSLADQESLKMSYGQYGAMAGTLVCIVEHATVQRFCRYESFDQLAQ